MRGFNESNNHSEQPIFYPDATFNLKATAIGILLSCTVVLTILGNSLVVLAVLRERHMRANLTNRFLVSLAIADLLMGSIVMPFALYHTIWEGDWAFGRDWCDFWHAFDVLSSTASILNLCAIAVERFWATENPINYASVRTRRRCGLMLISVWVCSIFISFPAIVWWRYSEEEDLYLRQPRSCHFTTDWIYLVVSSIVSFYFPLVVMVLVYWRIYKTATDLLRCLKNGEKIVSCEVGKNEKHFLKPPRNRLKSFPIYSNKQSDYLVIRMHRGGVSNTNLNLASTINAQWNPENSVSIGQNGCSFTENMQELYSKHNVSTKSMVNLYPPSQTWQQQASNSGSMDIGRVTEPNLCYTTFCCLPKPTSTHIQRPRLSIACLDLQQNSPDPAQSKVQHWMSKLRMFEVRTRVSKFVREQKAAKTLGLVMGLFISCWLPFFICNIVIAARPDLLVNNQTFSNIFIVVTWLGYINSCINPIIYAHSMREFRRAFKKLLCFGSIPHRTYYPYRSDRFNMNSRLTNTKRTLKPVICSDQKTQDEKSAKLSFSGQLSKRNPMEFRFWSFGHERSRSKSRGFQCTCGLMEDRLKYAQSLTSVWHHAHCPDRFEWPVHPTAAVFHKRRGKSCSLSLLGAKTKRMRTVSHHSADADL